MPDATTDSFLEGQGIPVDLRDIETELAKLWGPAAEQVGGPELENPHVTRIVLANLVVECLDRRRRVTWAGAGNGDRAVSVPGDRGARVGRPRAADHGRSVGALPPAGSGAAAGLLRADRAARRAECDRPGSRRRPALCSRPTCRWCSGGPATRGSTRRCSATWPTNARGWSSTCPTLVRRPARSGWGSTRHSARAAATAPGSA